MKNCGGYGPCEARTINAIGDEAIQQLYIFVVEYLHSVDWMEREFERLKKTQNQTIDKQIEIQEKVENAFEKLEEAAIGLKEYQQRYRLFCETVTKEIRKTALEIYPEIADMDSKQLLDFKYLFTREVQNMHASIEKLLSEKE